jgi:hypothetical protein
MIQEKSIGRGSFRTIIFEFETREMEKTRLGGSPYFILFRKLFFGRSNRRG